MASANTSHWLKHEKRDRVIRVSQKTHDRLRNMAIGEEDFESVIERLLNQHDDILR